MTTIIAYILIAYGISATIVLAFALDSIGYWKLQATEGEKYTRHLEQAIERRQAAINEWRMAANVLSEESCYQAQEAAYWRARQRVIHQAFWHRRQKRLGRVSLARMPL